MSVARAKETFSMTLKEIAEISGYSISAVSKALADAPDIGETTKKEIVAIAEEHGYIPRRKIKRAEPVRPFTVGLVLPEAGSKYFCRISSKLERALRAEGGMQIIRYSRYDPEKEMEDIRTLQKSGMVDAIISVSPFDVADRLLKTNVPVLVISQTDAELHTVDSVKVDDSYGIYCGIEQLHRMGHTKIGYIGDLRTEARFDYYKKALDECGVPLKKNLIQICDLNVSGCGYYAMKQLLEQPDPPTAVFCAYDKLAIDAWSAITECGLTVPGDISIFGVDDAGDAFPFGMQLASLDCHIQDQINIALDILKHKCKDPNFTTIQAITIKTDFLPRDTIGPGNNT